MDGVDFFPPAPDDYFIEHPDKWWPASKLGMEVDDIFNTLPQQFNCIIMPVLDRDAFNHEVIDISNKSEDRSEFDRLLEERMIARWNELLEMWSKAFKAISESPALLERPNTSQWPHAMYIYHFKSFDAYVRYFLGFLGPDYDSANSGAPDPYHDDLHLPAPSATSKSPSPSVAVKAAISERTLSPSVPASVSSSRRNTPQPRQTHVPKGRLASRRRPNQATIRSSDGIQKASLGDSRGLRRSSRLKEQTQLSGGDGARARSDNRLQKDGQPKKHGDHPQQPPTQTGGGTGRRKRGREEPDAQQPTTTTRDQRSAKKRKTDNTASPAPQNKRKRCQEEDHDQQPQATNSRVHASPKKRKTVSDTAENQELQTSQNQGGLELQREKDDTRLHQSGQRGDSEVQGTAAEAEEVALKTTAGRPRRRSARTGTGTRKGTKSDTHRVTKR